MSIYFNSSPVNFPFQFDSIGNNWDQGPTLRPDGFPLYHYLQTQEGCGILTIDGRDYTIEENQAFCWLPEFLMPIVPHPGNGSLYLLRSVVL